MAFVTTQPEVLTSAAGPLPGLGSMLSDRNAAAQCAAHAQPYHGVNAQAQALHEMFVSTLGTSSGSYAATEAANAAVTG